MKTNQSAVGQMTEIWASATDIEREAFLTKTGLIRKSQIADQLELVEGLEKVEEFLINRVKQTQEKYVEEFSDAYRLVMEHLGDLKRKSHAVSKSISE